MSQWLEEKYISLIGMQLQHFHKQSRTTYTFRCPVCGDSRQRSNKTRGYLFLYKGQYFYKCHNCTVSMSFRAFLRQQAPELFREYQLDVIRQDPASATVRCLGVTEKVTPMFRNEKSASTKLSLPSIDVLPEEHLAVTYCRNRKLPDAALSHLYFTEEWTTWIKEMKWSYALPEDHAPRLIIPWFDRQHHLLGAQARRIDATGSAARYVTLKHDSCQNKIYGWERVDLHSLIYIVEGPLDSWFLPNAVASMDADLLRIKSAYFESHASVLIWDNEPRNAAVVSNLYKAIKANQTVVVWPTHLNEKDLNDMAKAGHDVIALVKQHTVRGLRAELEFLRWRRA